MKHYPTVLSIAGSDPSGGAGIQADIKTCAAMGCYAMAAVTALTAQNSMGVRSVFNTSDFLESQLAAVLDDIRPDAVKIGMLPDVESVMTVAEMIKRYDLKNVVLDPVMAATSGLSLSSAGAVGVMCRELLPLVTLVTPNIPEARILAEMDLITNLDETAIAARWIAERHGTAAVLVKGGHLPGQGDLLYESSTGRVDVFDGEYFNSRNTHGTGCTMSSAIACGLASGCSLEEAVKHAKQFISEAIMAGADYDVGSGHGSVNHLFNIINHQIEWK
ncbi:MAG: bifunctional hydroxymethylpyrimidine kinase/phosphomethylpyrimidine kinase [Bacteroides sp.]|nr:bifunctional hydroxymethylpyrimidine kinase/phosphomethylpyrimidine kinase [Bacteroides sp.]